MANVEFDLVIVGASVVGATLACALKDSGLRIAIVESQPLEQGLDRQRAYAMSLLSADIFQGLGVWPAMEQDLGQYKTIQLSDGASPQVLFFESTDLERSYLGFAAPHRSLLKPLYAKLQNVPHLQWFCPAHVENIEQHSDRSTVTITMEGHTKNLQTKLVIGADGPNSFVRRQAQIKTRGWKYHQSCVTFVIKHTAPSNDIAFERFWPTGPMGVLPLPGNRCQIVWTHPTAEAETLQQLPPEQFIAKLNHYTGHLLGEIELLGDRLVFPVQLMQSDRYVQPRLALVGDAAHGCHPVGGQGLNLGIRDAVALAEVLLQAHRQGEDVGKLSVLQRYERWRKPENLIILTMTDVLNRLFSNQILPLIGLRRLSLLTMAGLYPVKVLVLKLMTGQLLKRPAVAKAVFPQHHLPSPNLLL
ncbi:MAG: FAD-dependent hydroxylase [Synechococcaceae cyanobacterium RL_1_2]|nr:FAD-dependent hydroxylase [Synechococcaceae cyanobacterium RL_1_2]